MRGACPGRGRGVVLAVALLGAGGALCDEIPETRGALARSLEALRELHRIPGMAVALVERGREPWLHVGGLADRATGRPVTPRSLFRLSSISKTLLALAAMRLVDAGRLDLGARVRDLAPDLPLENAWARTHPVTLGQLLEHTAALPDFHFDEVLDHGAGPPPRPGDVLRSRPGRLRTRWPPGERFAYSNRGYAVVAHVLERVAGRPFEEVVAEEVAAPLGLDGVSFALPPEGRAQLAQGYVDAGGAAVPYRPARFRAAANALGTLRDLARLTRFFLERGRLESGRSHLSPAAVARMERPGTSAAARAGLRVGAGVGLVANPRRAVPVLGHYGGGYAYQILFQYLPEVGRGYALAVNASHTRDGFDAANDLLLRFVARDREPPALPPPAAPPVHLVGWYQPGNPRHEPLAFLETLLGGVEVRGGPKGLRAHALGRPPRELHAYADGTLRLEGYSVPHLVVLERPEGTTLAGDGSWMVRQRWPWPPLLRASLLLALLLALSSLVALWGLWRGPRDSLAWARGSALAAALVAGGAAALALRLPVDALGTLSGTAVLVFLAGPTYGLLTLLCLATSLRALRVRGARVATLHAVGMAVAHAVLGSALAWAGLLGIRLWAD